MISTILLFFACYSCKLLQSFQIRFSKNFLAAQNAKLRIPKYYGQCRLFGQLSQSLESRSLSCLDILQVLAALKSHVVTKDARNLISDFVTSDTYSSATLRTRRHPTAVKRYQIVSEISNQLGYLPLQRDITDCLLNVLVKIERNLSPGPERSELAGFSLDLEGQCLSIYLLYI